MKLLFLDIDGVLNHVHSYDQLDHDCVVRLYDIIIQTGAKIVISSSWRWHKTIDVFKDYFRNEINVQRSHDYQDGVIDTIVNSMIGLTIDGIDLNMSRGDEIQHWLDNNSFDGKYAILDDIPGIIGENPNLFAISYKTGLTQDDVNAIIAHINKVN
ncbi:MAG TPA: HAD domain-containing protein [Methanosarcinales archaeon]|nr:HAD domain-containing protein [Methanosarcinales archaeon]